MDKDRIAEIVCYFFGCLMAYFVLMWIMPYLAIGFALYAFGYLVLESNKKNRRKRW